MNLSNVIMAERFFIGVKEYKLDIYFPSLTLIEFTFEDVYTAIDDLKDKPNDERLSHIIIQPDQEQGKKSPE